ncbi:MAG: phosphoribosylglycinamide formyltransferase [Proteobacteria bacterium]|nr:phosphoribosylglycinamide formyltransferase [Pseudomonadota bacterium]
MSLATVVLVSGNGSNLQAIIDAVQQGLDVQIRSVISNNPHAFGLERAKKAGIPAHAIDHKQFATRSDFEAALSKQIDIYHPDIIVLAGFMRQLTPPFVARYQGKMINVHPSLLPKYPGLNTHERVLQAGEIIHGVTIHYVTEDIDCGPIIAQANLTIGPGETIESLKKRIHTLEHDLYPKVLSWLAQGHISPLT